MGDKSKFAFIRVLTGIDLYNLNQYSVFKENILCQCLFFNLIKWQFSMDILSCWNLLHIFFIRKFKPIFNMKSFACAKTSSSHYMLYVYHIQTNISQKYEGFGPAIPPLFCCWSLYIWKLTLVDVRSPTFIHHTEIGLQNKSVMLKLIQLHTSCLFMLNPSMMRLSYQCGKVYIYTRITSYQSMANKKQKMQSEFMVENVENQNSRTQ